MDNPNSKIEKVKYGSKETVSHLATVDDMICYPDNVGGAVIEFVVHGKKKSEGDSWRITLCPEDYARLKAK